MLSVCYSVKNRTNYQSHLGVLTLLSDSVESVEESCSELNIPFEIVIADWKSTDTDYNWLAESHTIMGVECNDDEFSRGGGLNIAAENSQYNNLLFLDSDMLVNAKFISRCLDTTSHGVGYFPICWSLAEQDKDIARTFLGNDDLPNIDYASARLKPEDTHPEISGWRECGKGMCCVTREQWSSVGGWPVYSVWGGEDWHFWDALAMRGERLVRQKDSGLIHCWHPKKEK